MKYWLIKTEPGNWSWEDQLKAKGQRTSWDGVRNAQACNNMKAMSKGDRAFFYHSVKEKTIVGIVEIVKQAYPDPSDESGRAVMVDVKAVEAMPELVTLKQIKADERAPAADKSALAGVAKALPALKRAQKLGKRASVVGFDWPDRQGVHEKIREELAELEQAVGARSRADINEEFGDMLFAVVNLARHLEVDPESALTAANYKFEERFRNMEQAIIDNGKKLAELTLESLEKEWRAAKHRLSEQ